MASACIYCGEEINLDARICRHCNRTALYGVVLIQRLSDREKHIFLRKWQSLEKAKLNHLALASYGLAKDELEKIPLTLSWDLTRADANRLLGNFPDFQKNLEIRISTALNPVSSYESFVAKNTSPSQKWSALAYGFIALLFFGAGAYFLFKQSDSGLPRTLTSIDHRDKNIAIPDLQIAPATPHKAAAPSADTPNLPFSMSREQMADLLNATVFIRDDKTLGSGFVITGDGYILTNAHVTSPMEKPVVILRDGRQFEATKIKEDKQLDVALIRIGAYDLEPLKMGDANQLYAGQSVLTIGNPGGLSFTVTRGIVSFLGRNIHGIPFIQTDAAINRGNSGGPMINDKMEVVGINSLTSLNEQGISFSLPINFVCQTGGIATDIGFDCPAFKGDQDPAVSQAAFDSQKRNALIESYKKEADQYRADLHDNIETLTNSYNELKSTFDAKKAEFDKTKDPSLFTDLKQMEARSNEISKNRVLVQVKYIDLMIDLLQRQKAEAEFAASAPTIDKQIAELEESKTKLTSSTGSSN